MSLLVSTNGKSESNNFILINIDYWTKIIHYKPLKIIIDTLRLGKVITNIVIYYYGISELIVTDSGLLFISKFWLLLYYFLEIQKNLFTTFYLQINSQTKR